MDYYQVGLHRAQAQGGNLAPEAKKTHGILKNKSGALSRGADRLHGRSSSQSIE